MTVESIERLYDEFTKFKREVEDRLENLTFENFSSAVKLQIRKGGGVAGFEAMADELRSMARLFSEYGKSLAEVKLTSDRNGSAISLLTRHTDELAEDMSDAMTRIDGVSNAGGAVIGALASANGYEVEFDEVGGRYIFKKDGSEVTASEADVAGILISAVNGGGTTVKLMADKIEFGDNASVDEDGNLRIKRLWHTSGEQFYAQVGNTLGSFADFGVYDSVNGHFAWRFYNDDMAGKVMHLRFYEEDVLGYYGRLGVTCPLGKWDFSGCEVKGLGVVAVFG